MLRGDNKGAVELLEEVLQIQRGAYGPENRQVLIAIVNLAAARATLGMHDQARHDLIAILPAIEHVFGKDHPLEAAALDGLVVASEGQPEEAIAYGRRAVAITIASEGVDSPTTAGRRQNLAGALTHAHQYPEAVALLRLALATFDHQTATDAVERLQVRLDLGGALLATKQPREARPLLDQARAGFAKAGDAANVAACDLALADADLAQHARVAAEARIDAVLAAHPDDKDASRAHALAWRAAHPR
jgi:tetratricopeptide (TPR) repeat protein